VVGDVQRTSAAEYCLLCRELNDREQRLLRNDMDRQAFGAIVLVGDLAFDGGDARWAHFDALLSPLRRSHSALAPNGTAFFPVMGNHDYAPGSPAQMRRRFPGLTATGTHYAYDWGAVRLIILDANREQLCPPAHLAGRREPPAGPICHEAWQAELEWLRRELANVDGSPTARGALLFVHQSPYTRSPWVEADQRDAQDFAQLLLASTRGLALISAHAHGFERYRFTRDANDPRPAKDFIVTAGGGGPRPAKPRNGASQDESELPWPRPFNYLLLSQSASGVDVSVRGLDKSDSAVRELTSERRSLAFR
jgi:hypothetical protein